MGFNVAGLAINKSFKDNFEELQSELGWSLEKQGDIDFETACSSFKDDGTCDVYFSENGTLLLLSFEDVLGSWKMKNANTLTFALSEVSMAFNLSYCENGVEVRSIMEAEDERFADSGEELEIESQSEDTSEIIWNQMGVVLGKSFWEIEPDEKVERYTFVKAESKITVTETPAEQKPNPQPQISAAPTKRWWQFWK